MDAEAGKAAYVAYRKHVGGRSPVSGDKLPRWKDMSDMIQGGWTAAAYAAAMHDRQVRGLI